MNRSLIRLMIAKISLISLIVLETAACLKWGIIDFVLRHGLNSPKYDALFESISKLYPILMITFIPTFFAMCILPSISLRINRKRNK